MRHGCMGIGWTQFGGTLSRLTAWLARGFKHKPGDSSTEALPHFVRMEHPRAQSSAVDGFSADLIEVSGFLGHLAKVAPTLQRLYEGAGVSGRDESSSAQSMELSFRGTKFPNASQIFYVGVLKGSLLLSLRRRLAREGTHWARTHGDLHVENVLIDRSEHDISGVFVIDFATFNAGHAGEDLCKLEVSMLLFVTQEDLPDNSVWFAEAVGLAQDLARDLRGWRTEAEQQHLEESRTARSTHPIRLSILNCARRRRAPGSAGRRELLSPSLQLAERAIRHWRLCAIAAIGNLTATEHRLTLLRWVFLMARYQQLPSDAHRHLAFAYAGFLAEQLSAAAAEEAGVESHAGDESVAMF